MRRSIDWRTSPPSPVFHARACDGAHLTCRSNDDDDDDDDDDSGGWSERTRMQERRYCCHRRRQLWLRVVCVRVRACVEVVWVVWRECDVVSVKEGAPGMISASLLAGGLPFAAVVAAKSHRSGSSSSSNTHRGAAVAIRFVKSRSRVGEALRGRASQQDGGRKKNGAAAGRFSDAKGRS
jgi:hypothetical protein